jgi:hypothetical protein
VAFPPHFFSTLFQQLSTVYIVQIEETGRDLHACETVITLEKSTENAFNPACGCNVQV